MSLKARMISIKYYYVNVNKCNLSFLILYVRLNLESKAFSFYFVMICEIK